MYSGERKFWYPSLVVYFGTPTLKMGVCDINTSWGMCIVGPSDMFWWIDHV